MPRCRRPLWAAVSGSRREIGEPRRGQKGRAAREWIPAGHGCIGRRPSSLLASCVWLPPGSTLEGRTRLGLKVEGGRQAGRQ